MMKKKENKKQHYIPQCYLKKFSPNERFVFVYDKQHSKQYESPVSGICYHEYLYQINKTTIDQALDSGINILPTYFEKDYFSNLVERDYDKFLSKIIQSKISNNKDEKVLSEEDKFQFALLLSVQWYRLPDHKEAAYNFKQDSWNKKKEVVKSFLAYQKNDPRFLDLDVNMITDPAIDHAELYTPENAIQLAKVMTENYWEFLYTDDDSIYTSDFPFVIKPHIESALSCYNGFGMYGSEASFPISSNIVLVIWDKNYFKDKQNIDCSFTPLDEDGVWRYNSFRYFYAKGKVFSKTNDFQLVEQYKKRNDGKEVFCKVNLRTNVY